MRAWGMTTAVGALMALAHPAAAVPPDRVIRFERAGEDRFVRGPAGDWQAFCLPPGVVEVRSFETEEVHLNAVGPGRALVVLHSRVLATALFWRVVVGQPPPARPDDGAVRAACRCQEVPGEPLECRVDSEPCFRAVHAFLSAAEDLEGAALLRLTYTVEGLQVALRQLQPRLEATGFGQVRLAFAGVNLRLSGAVDDEDAWRRLLAGLYAGWAGRLLIEDRVERRRAPAADAGAGEGRSEIEP